MHGSVFGGNKSKQQWITLIVEGAKPLAKIKFLKLRDWKTSSRNVNVSQSTLGSRLILFHHSGSGERGYCKVQAFVRVLRFTYFHYFQKLWLIKPMYANSLAGNMKVAIKEAFRKKESYQMYVIPTNTKGCDHDLNRLPWVIQLPSLTF